MKKSEKSEEKKRIISSLFCVSVCVCEKYHFEMMKKEMLHKQETFIIASDQMKAHFPHTIVKNTDFH
jgi:hypothetical protein